MAYMTNTNRPTNPSTYCGASHHTTRTSTGDVGRLRAFRLPTGATIHGALYSTWGTWSGRIARTDRSGGNGVAIVSRQVAAA